VITQEDRDILARALARNLPEVYDGCGPVFSNTSPTTWNRLIAVGLVDGETGEVKDEDN